MDGKMESKALQIGKVESGSCSYEVGAVTCFGSSHCPFS